ncbi:MAG: hypothetical protein ACERKO_10335 [Acetanaerobacterium sp.]
MRLSRSRRLLCTFLCVGILITAFTGCGDVTVPTPSNIDSAGYDSNINNVASMVPDDNDELHDKQLILDAFMKSLSQGEEIKEFEMQKLSERYYVA